MPASADLELFFDMDYITALLVEALIFNVVYAEDEDEIGRNFVPTLVAPTTSIVRAVEPADSSSSCAASSAAADPTATPAVSSSSSSSSDTKTASETTARGARFVSISVSPPMENIDIDQPLREFEGVSVGCWLREGAPLQMAVDALVRDERMRDFWEIN